MNFSSGSVAETRTIAKDIIEMVLLSHPRGARVLGLVGALGAGKTTFVQGLAAALGIKDRVLSPTFILMRPFDIRASRRPLAPLSRLWHIDCYRVLDPRELLRVGLGDILEDPHNLVVVEWADKVKKLLPKDAAWVRFEYGKKGNERMIILKPNIKSQKSK